MKIENGVLTPDVSLWCNHIKSKEFEDGGCQSIIVGLYYDVVKGKKILKPVCKKQIEDVVKNSNLVLQVYYWVDITIPAIDQVNWVWEIVSGLISEGYPVKWIWADLEQWWNNWSIYNKWRGTKPSPPVPPSLICPQKNISIHFETFMSALYAKTKNCGYYCNKGFIDSWATPMNLWIPKYCAWIAQYGKEANSAMKITWEQFKKEWLPSYNLSLATGQSPEKVMGHQFTGDIFELAGSYDKYDGINNYDGRLTLDVSVFRKEFIDGLRGNTPPSVVVTPPVVITPPVIVTPPISYSQYKTIYSIYARQGATGQSQLIGIIPANTVINVDDKSGMYSHFLPNEQFKQGGWCYTYYLQKM